VPCSFGPPLSRLPILRERHHKSGLLEKADSVCGKFSQMYSWAEIHAFSDLIGNGGGDGPARRDANDQEQTVTPMREARVIRLNVAGQREVVGMRWGWPDRWSKAPMDRPKHMHAKSETIAMLRTFAPSFSAGRRGIIAVKTFNVGEEVGKKVVQHVLTPRDGKPLGIAVIWDEVPKQDGELLLAFVMVTTAPNAVIGSVTDRMPAIIPPEQWGVWLGETTVPLPEVKAVTAPYQGDLDMALQPKAPPKPRSRPSPPSMSPLMF
jgi:putative SOS response-associated peptidase YedK